MSLIRVINQGKGPFAFSFVGVSYILPPPGGGLYRSESVPNEVGAPIPGHPGQKYDAGTHAELVLIGPDPTIPNYVDLPQEAKGYLDSIAHLMRKADVVVKTDLVVALDEQVKETQAKNKSLLDQQNALIADIEKLRRERAALEIDEVIRARESVAAMMPSPQAGRAAKQAKAAETQKETP